MKIQHWVSALVVMTAMAIGGGLAVKMQSTEVAQLSQELQATEPDQLSDATDTAHLRDFPHRSIVLRDEVVSGSEFDQFRQKLRQAVQSRDADFAAALIPASGVSLGFGAPLTIEELDLHNPNALLWSILEKALFPGCDPLTAQEAYSNGDAEFEGWVCHNLNQLFVEQYPAPATAQGVDYELSQVIVVGENVNVRAQPSTNSDVIGILSNELVEFDRMAWEELPPEDQSLDLLSGWTPVILPNNRSGYVSNRYAYSPLGYRVLFGKVNGQWQILHIPGGD
ncbi:SH3 domain-containing protein [Thermocoleostomius sinensis]|uniref:SH3 domain-containing protein n=1 Tax=Thermocoleostomius sinensis A174 TaxID=2016057 RepID=A0A9E9C855_9CYAN|nr:SH3 domain-containing protein [Thermocoleostomius sinensis]WAL58052.1 SH3 domain-containing protein [Thermocoleostomius sinensis A174]